MGLVGQQMSLPEQEQLKLLFALTVTGAQVVLGVLMHASRHFCV